MSLTPSSAQEPPVPPDGRTPRRARRARRVVVTGAVAVTTLLSGVTATATPDTTPPATESATEGPPMACEVPASTPNGHSEAANPPLPKFNGRATPIGGEKLTGTGIVTDLPSGVPAPPGLRACAWLVADLETGEVIAARAPHAMYLPASTIKTLTALTVIDDLGLDTVITAENEDAAVDGTKVGMVPGGTYTSHNLMQAMMMSSANDAAHALARTAGGMQATTDQMDATARNLGAFDTNAENASGLDASGQLTSVYDLALFGRAALAHTDIAPILTTRSADFPGAPAPEGQARETMQIGNHNRLIWNYDGAVGVKTGYTIAAGHTYIGAARRGETGYLVTYLKSEVGNWREATAMLDWAYEHGDAVEPVGRLVEPGELDPTTGDPTETEEDASNLDPAAPAAAMATGPSGSSNALIIGVSAASILLGAGLFLVIRRPRR